MTDRVDESTEAGLPLLEPLGPVSEPVTDADALAATVAALRAGRGPVGVDAERASGYRYGQRCYLVQIYREGAGTFVVDPVALPDLSTLDAALADMEWILHAASQDLPGLADLGMRPRLLFDTELAARLADFDRVGLAAMVEHVLGRRLDKGPSSADWSQRPLPPHLLRYAALDVEVLPALRDHLDAELREQGKRDWAAEEFAAILAAPPKEPRTDPWRRTSGLHRVRTPRQLAGVRALWQRRDDIARARDLAPGRVLPDSAIIDAVLRWPSTAEELAELPVFGGRANRRRLATWLSALEEAAALPDRALPRPVAATDHVLPPTHRWVERDPAAAARLAAVRPVVAGLAEKHRLRVENLLEPAALRRLAWSPPEPVSAAAIAEALRATGAREWQISLAAGPLAEALASAAT